MNIQTEQPLYYCDVDDDIVLFETPDQANAEDRASAIAHNIFDKYDEEIPHYIGNVELWHQNKGSEVK